MRLAKRAGAAFANPVQFLLEEVCGDRDVRATLWSPAVPAYLLSGDRTQIPQQPYRSTEELPTRTLVMHHPTRVPFFGEVTPTVTMTQKLLLLDDREFWVFNSSTLTGMLYAENFVMRGYYKIVQLGRRE